MGGVREEAKERARAQLCRLGSPPLAVDKERGRGHQRRHLFFFFHIVHCESAPLWFAFGWGRFLKYSTRENCLVCGESEGKASPLRWPFAGLLFFSVKTRVLKEACHVFFVFFSPPR